MKKPKIKLDKAQALEFLTAHVEKGVFGLFILGFIMFCLGAMKHTPYDKVPKDFMDAAQRVDTKVTASTFDPATDVPPMPPLPEARDVPEAEWATHEFWSRPAFDMKKSPSRAEVPGSRRHSRGDRLWSRVRPRFGKRCKSACHRCGKGPGGCARTTQSWRRWRRRFTRGQRLARRVEEWGTRPMRLPIAPIPTLR